MTAEEKSKVNIPLIGILAVKNLLITKEELKKSLQACAGEKDLDEALKSYFLTNEMISSQNIERLVRAAKALELRQKEFKFGAIAIRKGYINKSVLKLVLEEQQQYMKKHRKMRLIGDLLVDANMLSEKQRDGILKLQKRMRSGDESAAPASSTENTDETGSEETAKETGLNEESKQEQSPKEDAEQDAEALLEPEIIDGGVKLQVSKDFMSAFLTKTDYFDSDVSVVRIQDSLFDKGIIKGVVADEMIEGFIKSSGFKTKSFRVAKGTAPIQGEDAKIEFFFNTDYLKAGGVNEEGIIDFKDRGEIPHVEEGTVLAEKIPMVESRVGLNIYGDEIETLPGADLPLKIGKGAKLSEDGLKVIAAVKGFPKYSLSGYIFVHQEYVTEGDVDYETGHIKYDGNVNVKGRIKSGFKVEANDVLAVELDGGIVVAEGDVVVAGGINEGSIYARGNVQARFIHNSTVVCMGDIVVEKEIVDSTVESSGSCITQNGKLISSKITAKMGVTARNIGTEMAGPNVVKVGFDAFTEKELEENKAKVDKVKQQIENILRKNKELSEENTALQKQITELAHVQDRAQLEIKELNEKMAASADAGQAQDAQKRIAELEENAKKAETELDECFDRSEQIEDIIEQHKRDIKTLEERREVFLDERANLIQWSKDNPGKPVVICDGAIMPETLIVGKHSEKRFTELTRHARVTEVLVSSDSGSDLNIYEMKVGSI